MLLSPVLSFAAILLPVLHISCFVAGAKPTALFVFGDSYADTGNHNPSDPVLYMPWWPPYGHTWPGRPSGRFSDGRVLTDFIASFLGISSALPYRAMRESNAKEIARGINFAFGGSGVFSTFGPKVPNVSVQISQLHETIHTGVLSKELLPASLVLLVLAGNDYTVYTLKHPGDEGLMDFVATEVDQIVADLRTLYNLGFRRFAVANLEPFGCLPAVTKAENYASCNETTNAESSYHNKVLSAHISELKKLPGAKFIILDLYNAFSLALGKTFKHGKANPFQPCCQGIGNGSCGEVDSMGRALYTVCSNANQAFFWDSVHPTQAGWKAVFKALRALSFWCF